jgi:hypothetical protein
MHESRLKDSVYILSENMFKPSSLKGVKKERKMASGMDIKVWRFTFILLPLRPNIFEKS